MERWSEKQGEVKRCGVKEFSVVIRARRMTGFRHVRKSEVNATQSKVLNVEVAD